MADDFTRREFLGHSVSATTVAAASLALGGVHAWAEDRPRTIRLGIIGCGGIMTHHVKGLVERREAVSIAWLCDVDPRADRQDGRPRQRLPIAAAEADGAL